MGRLQEFLLGASEAGEATVEVFLSGIPYPFIVKSITEKEKKPLERLVKQ